MNIRNLESSSNISFRKHEVSIVTVNYNTPGLLRDLLESIRKYCPAFPVYVVDGSDNIDKIREVQNIARNYDNVILFSMGKNIHHGPGIDFGIRKAKSRYVLLLDTDSIILKPGLIEVLLEKLDGNYGIGKIEFVDQNGWNVKDENGIPYLHPRCALIDKKQYFLYEPAIKHGAPMIAAMKDIYEKGRSSGLINYDNLNDFYYHIGRGTVNLTGGYHFDDVIKTKSKFKALIRIFINKLKGFFG